MKLYKFEGYMSYKALSVLDNSSSCRSLYNMLTTLPVNILSGSVVNTIKVIALVNWGVLVIYLIISGFLFVVCSSRTIFGKKSKAHVHLERWKHGNGEVRLNMVCTQ